MSPQGAQILSQDTQISLRVPRCCYGWRGIAPHVQMLLQHTQIPPRVPRCCPGGQTLPQAALLSPLGAQLSHLGSGSHWQPLAALLPPRPWRKSLPAVAVSSPCAAGPGPVSPARPGVPSPACWALWIFARSHARLWKITPCRKPMAPCHTIGLKSKHGSAPAPSCITWLGCKVGDPGVGDGGSSPAAMHSFLPSASSGCGKGGDV